jgi:hypothetical protein
MVPTHRKFNETPLIHKVYIKAIQQTTKQTPWSDSASELYRPNDLRLSAKLVPTFAGRGVSRSSNDQICVNLNKIQSNALRMIVDAPWYVPNTVIRRDLQTPTVKEEIRRYSSQHSARLSAHPNDLIVNLIELPDNRRLRIHLPNDLPTRFLV